MDEKVFVYLRLRVGEVVVSRSKIREFAALPGLLPSFLRQAISDGARLALELSPGRPVLDYVDANTEETLVSFRLDPERQVQVVEGRIPPDYQHRMLDPDLGSASLGRFMASAEVGLTEAEQEELAGRLNAQRPDLLDSIRQTMDEDGRFVVHFPIS